MFSGQWYRHSTQSCVCVIVSTCAITGVGSNTSMHAECMCLIPPSLNDLHSTMSCVLSEELAPTPLEAVQVMVAKALSLITLVSMRSLVTLNVAA